MNFRGSGSSYSVMILQGVGEWIRVLSVGHCVIPCEFFGKSVKHTFSCRKIYTK